MLVKFQTTPEQDKQIEAIQQNMGHATASKAVQYALDNFLAYVDECQQHKVEISHLMSELDAAVKTLRLGKDFEYNRDLLLDRLTLKDE